MKSQHRELVEEAFNAALTDAMKNAIGAGFITLSISAGAITFCVVFVVEFCYAYMREAPVDSRAIRNGP
jgi:hypothetical protein